MNQIWIVQADRLMQLVDLYELSSQVREELWSW